MSAECDLPCREHDYPREELNTGGLPGANLPQPAFKEERGGCTNNTRRAIQLPASRSSSQLPTCRRSDLAAPSPPRGAGSHSGERFSTGPWWLWTQRAGRPPVITACKWHLRAFLIRPLSCRFNWPGPFITRQHARTSVAPRGGEGPGVICSVIHLEISSFIQFFFPVFPFLASSFTDFKFKNFLYRLFSLQLRLLFSLEAGKIEI